MTPSSSSLTAREVEVLAVWAGAKAAADPARRAAMASFIVNYYLLISLEFVKGMGRTTSHGPHEDVAIPR